MNLLSRLIIVGICLALFGIQYNAWVARQEARGRHDGYVAIYVVVGVLAVLGGSACIIVPLGQGALLALAIVGAMFCAAGSPMIYGSVMRHLDAREREQAQLTKETHDLITKGK